MAYSVRPAGESIRRAIKRCQSLRSAAQPSAVPEISRFFGIVVSIQFRDHEPPHFHATYGDQEVSVDIRDGRIAGSFPKKTLRLVQKWRTLHRQELLENWHRARERRPLNPIAPLE